jgi:hypothetical protein
MKVSIVDSNFQAIAHGSSDYKSRNGTDGSTYVNKGLVKNKDKIYKQNSLDIDEQQNLLNTYKLTRRKSTLSVDKFQDHTENQHNHKNQFSASTFSMNNNKKANSNQSNSVQHVSRRTSAPHENKSQYLQQPVSSSTPNSPKEKKKSDSRNKSTSIIKRFSFKFRSSDSKDKDKSSSKQQSNNNSRSNSKTSKTQIQNKTSNHSLPPQSPRMAFRQVPPSQYQHQHQQQQHFHQNQPTYTNQITINPSLANNSSYYATSLKVTNPNNMISLNNHENSNNYSNVIRYNSNTNSLNNSFCNNVHATSMNHANASIYDYKEDELQPNTLDIESNIGDYYYL